MIQSLKTVLPIKQKENARVKKRVRLLLNEEDGRKKLEYYLEKNQRARARLMAALLDDQVLDYELVSRKLNITLAVVRALEEQGVLTLETEQVYRNPVKGKREECSITFTEEQRHAVDVFWKDFEQEKYGTYLLYGVTGSGSFHRRYPPKCAATTGASPKASKTLKSIVGVQCTGSGTISGMWNCSNG